MLEFDRLTARVLNEVVNSSNSFEKKFSDF